MSNGDFTNKLRRYQKKVEALKLNNLNEADTNFHLGNFFINVLGYDPLKDISREFAIRSTYCDYAIKIKGKFIFLVEVKAMPIKLKESHLRQTTSYAMNAGIEWCLLTNGIDFRFYHIEFTKPIDKKQVFSFNILEEDIKTIKKKLHYLTKTSFRKNEVNDYWAAQCSLSDHNLAAALLSPEVLKIMRRVLKRNTNANLELEQIGKAIRDLFDESLNIKISTKKISKQKSRARVKAKTSPTQEPNSISAQSLDNINSESNKET